MSRVFLIQTETGQADPWDDSINISNVAVNPSLGNTNNPAEHTSRITYYQRSDNRFTIMRSPTDDADIILSKPYTNDTIRVKISLEDVGACTDGARDKAILCASIIEDGVPMTQAEAVEKAQYYMRNKNGDIMEMSTGLVIQNPKMIPWFFCYRTDEAPVYYIVMNHHSIQSIGLVDGDYGNNKVFVLSNHLRNLNDVIFKPKFGRTARLIGDHNVLVRGDEFTIEPFGSWFVKEHMPDHFKDVKVKIDTNFEYEIIGGKIKFKTINKDKGYVYLRWNTGTVMDMSFHNSKNRFFREYIVDVIR
jgi:hypothetical protein